MLPAAGSAGVHGGETITCHVAKLLTLRAADGFLLVFSSIDSLVVYADSVLDDFVCYNDVSNLNESESFTLFLGASIERLNPTNGFKGVLSDIVLFLHHAKEVLLFDFEVGWEIL